MLVITNDAWQLFGIPIASLRSLKTRKSAYKEKDSHCEHKPLVVSLRRCASLVVSHTLIFLFVRLLVRNH